jgi:hypothetical protein
MPYINQLMNPWADEQMNEWTNKPINQWTDEPLSSLKYEPINPLINKNVWRFLKCLKFKFNLAVTLNQIEYD